MKLKFINSVCALIVLFPSLCFAQGVGINSNNSVADNSAILDVKATNKGMLIPRIRLTSTTDVTTIPSPATSLLIYNTATVADVVPGFYYYNGTSWTALLNNEQWSKTGNLGTSSGTNFIGTTDAQALDFRTNNVLKTRITTKGQLEIFNTGESVFIGEDAGANDDLTNNRNVFIGYQVGRYNTTGWNNTAIGTFSFRYNTTGYGNTAFGFNALSYNTIGHLNTAVGNSSLFLNTTGYGNAATGHYALYYNTTGNKNTGIGIFSLYSNTTGTENTGIGAYSLYSNTTGTENTALGFNALYHNNVGINNTAVGNLSLNWNISGENNTALGYQAYRLGTVYSNSTALGANTIITASDQVRIGWTNVTSIGGQVAWTTLSDKRFKTNIQSNVPGLDFINKLNPVTYNLDVATINNFLGVEADEKHQKSILAKSKIIQTGFLAQDVEAAAQSLGYDFSGVDAPKNENDYYGLRYAEFTVPLVKAVQELSQENEKLKAQNQVLEARLEAIEALLSNIQQQAKK